MSFWLIHGAFILTGAVTTLLGPILPFLVAWWRLHDAQAGMFFTLQFVSSMAGVALSSAAMSRKGYRFTLGLGLVLMAAGVAALAAGARSAGVAGVLCYGIGLGVTMPATNVFVAQSQPHRSASALNVLNFAWGVGAIGLPAAVAVVQRLTDVRVLLWGLAAALALAAGLVSRRHSGVTHTLHRSDPGAPTRPVARWREALAFGAILFVYVGTETAVSGWIALYARRLALPSSAATVAPSLFWAAILAGRGLAPLVLRTLPERRLVSASVIVAGLGVALIAMANGSASLAVGIAAAGLGCATVFPVSIALFTREFGVEAARYSGVVFALSALGGATLPWLVGIVSSRTGTLKAGLLVPLAGCIVVLALHEWRSRRAAQIADAELSG